VVLGGGTGTFTVLTGLKRHPVELSTVAPIADRNGLTGVLPSDDIRQCLIALSSGDKVMRRVFATASRAVRSRAILWAICFCQRSKSCAAIRSRLWSRPSRSCASAAKSVIEVENVWNAVSQLAQTTRRNIGIFARRTTLRARPGLGPYPRSSSRRTP